MSNESRILQTDLTWIIVATLLVFFVGFGAAFAIPAFDADLYRIDANTPSRSLQEFDGKGIYESEGCQYCHTQEVRPVAVDLGLGKVASPSRSARDYPSVMGLVRIGPDLSCVGDRYKTPEEIGARIVDPRSGRPGSTMPSFSFLSSDEIEDLSAYLYSLQCGGGK